MIWNLAIDKGIETPIDKTITDEENKFTEALNEKPVETTPNININSDKEKGKEEDEKVKKLRYLEK